VPFEQVRCNDVVLVCWIGEPHHEEIEAVLAHLAEVGKELGRLPVFLSTNVDVSVLPPEDVRVAFRANFSRLIARVSELHLVPGGNAFLRAVIRSALTTVINATGARGRVFVHDRLAVALDALEARGHLRVDEVRPLLVGAWQDLP
jgi:hypothetical protein